MDAYEIIITPDAEADLREIRGYIVHVIGDKNAALSQIRSIRHAIEGLRSMPARVRLLDEEPWHSRGVRRLLAGNYFVYYRIDEGEGRVYVLNVIFARMDQLRALSRGGTGLS